MSKDTVWSTKVQSIKQLDYSRELRFRDDRKDLYLDLIGFKSGMTVADIGCGPGTLTRKLAVWLGKSSKIIGIDRDINFIKYAQKKAKELGLNSQIQYIKGDALNIPLEDNSVDGVTSHTLIEHVPNKELLLEKRRICKPGGRVSVQCVWTQSKISTFPNFNKVPQQEQLIWNKISHAYNSAKESYDVGKYWPDLINLPKLFEEVRLINIYVDALAFPYVIDDDRNTLEEKRFMIKVLREEEKEAARNGYNMLEGKMSEKEFNQLIDFINKRYDKRLNILESKEKLWDYEINIVWIVSGEVI
jgi:ubiquinone/menaquinone biosynthesis C-methylase UbiE